MNRFLLTIVGLFCLISLGTPACTVAAGESCQIDSDCEPGTLCSLDGLCQTFDEVANKLAGIGAQDTSEEPKDTESELDISLPEDSAPTDQDGSCVPAYGAIFTEPSTKQSCAEPTVKRKVAFLQIAKEGHGAVNAANIGNDMIKDAFISGDTLLSMWVDGSFEDGCEWSVAWMRDEADRLDDCTATFTDTMPFSIPELLEATIYQAKFNPETNEVTGLIDTAELLASLDEAIRGTAAKFFNNDKDLDNDGEADHASVILELTFED